MNNVSSGTMFIAALALVFVLIMTGMVVQAVREKDRKNRIRIIARIIGVSVLVIGFIVVWFRS